MSTFGWGIFMIIKHFHVYVCLWIFDKFISKLSCKFWISRIQHVCLYTDITLLGVVTSQSRPDWWFIPGFSSRSFLQFQPFSPGIITRAIRCMINLCNSVASKQTAVVMVNIHEVHPWSLRLRIPYSSSSWDCCQQGIHVWGVMLHKPALLGSNMNRYM